MQLPQLYLRGSLAKVTMKSLTENEKAIVEHFTNRIVKMQSMQGDKNEFMHQLSVTIGGDYAQYNSKEAEQEFYIAVWRGVVHLLYHKSYEFKCGKCNNTEYQTKRNTLTPINRQFPICPSCEHVKLVGSDDYIHFDEVKNSITEIKHESPIKTISGCNKVQQAQEILEDESQVSKFFGEFVWNYFRQIINENKITHQQKEQKVTGCVDIITTELIISLLKQYNVKYYYEGIPKNGYHTLHLKVHSTIIEFTTKFVQLANDMRRKGAIIMYTDSSILIKDLGAESPISDITMLTTEKVSTVGSGQGGTDECDDYMRILEEENMNTFQDIDTEDTICHIRKLLSPLAQKVYNLIIQDGYDYAQYSTQYGAGQPKVAHLAKHLKCTSNAIKTCIEEIKLATLSCY